MLQFKPGAIGIPPKVQEQHRDNPQHLTYTFPSKIPCEGEMQRHPKDMRAGLPLEAHSLCFQCFSPK